MSLLDENAVPTSGMRKAWMGCKVGYVARMHEMGQWMEHVPHSQLCDARARLVNCAGEVGDLSLFFLGGRPRAKERAREVQRDRDRDRATDGRVACLCNAQSAANKISSEAYSRHLAPAGCSRVDYVSLTLDWAKFTERAFIVFRSFRLQVSP